jgi:hypothetical protein
VLTPEQLLLRLANQEDALVERKLEGVRPADLRRTATAFANSVPEGSVGLLFVGVHDRTGEAVGVENPDQFQKNLRAFLHGDCYPPIQYDATVLTVGDNHIVSVQFPYSDRKPHFAGGAYVRVGSESVAASEQQYEELIFSRNDKVREILKYRNGLYTVLGVGYRLGSHRRLHDANYRESLECRVEQCTPHAMRLSVIASNRYITESLSRVEIGWDEERYRPLLIVTFD